jgi:hypothetical protein
MRTLRVISAAIAASVFIPLMAGAADPLRRAQPEEVGMSPTGSRVLAKWLVQMSNPAASRVP